MKTDGNQDAVPALDDAGEALRHDPHMASDRSPADLLRGALGWDVAVVDVALQCRRPTVLLLGQEIQEALGRGRGE